MPMRQPPFLPQLPREEYELEGVADTEFKRKPLPGGLLKICAIDECVTAKKSRKVSEMHNNFPKV